MGIIINADDFGFSKEVNDAIVYCFVHQYIQKTSLMVNMPYSDDAVLLARDNGFDNQLGLHLNLVEGVPLTEDIKRSIFCDKEGVFNGSIMNKKNRIFLKGNEIRVVEQEIKAQIEKYINYGCLLDHIDSHRHAHTNYSVLPLLLNSIKLYENCLIRLSRNIPKAAMSGVKGLYKTYINNRIFDHNQNAFSSMNCKYFGSINDYESFEKEGGTTNNFDVEIMIHPVMVNGKLSDAINNYSIEEWIRKRG